VIHEAGYDMASASQCSLLVPHDHYITAGNKKEEVFRAASRLSQERNSNCRERPKPSAGLVKVVVRSDFERTIAYHDHSNRAYMLDFLNTILAYPKIGVPFSKVEPSSLPSSLTTDCPS
jgi:hypothetical protein